MTTEIQDTSDFWLRLDNASKIYPAIKDRELTSVFRVAVELKGRIKAKQFLEAVEEIEERFPYYKVKLKAGFFWYYLEPHKQSITVIPDKGVPCRAFDKKDLMFRVLAKDNKISVEFSHILTDGTGAFEFLKTLLIVYFQKCLLAIPPDLSFLHPRGTPSKEEFEDAYNRYFKKIDGGPAKIPKAFHVPFRLRTSPRFDVTTVIVSIQSILKKAKEYEVSLTEYLTAVYLFSLQNIYNELSNFTRRTSNKIIRIEVPVMFYLLN